LKMYDAIVVGAGTAGCMAAKILASEGYDVCLIDRKDRRQIGDKVCGDAIGKHHFDNLGLPYPSGDEKEGDITGVKIYSPDKRTIFKISGYGLTGFMINRHLFGQRLLRYAIDSGAELKDGIHVSKPIIKDGYVIGISAKRLKTGEKIEFFGRVTVDASGVSAVIRRKLPSIMGVDVNVEPEDLVVCYREIRKLRRSIEEPEFCEIYLSQRIAPGGYYWIFPKTEGRVNVGLGVSQTRREANPKIQLYKNVISEPIFESSEIIDSGGGIVPTRRPLDSLVGNGVVFIGDSGCQVNPIHGGGIGPSMMGGKISGEVISEALEKGDVSIGALWPINVRFMENYGLKQAGLDIFRIFLQGLTDEELNYGMKYQLITEEDVLKASIGEEIRLNISEVARRVLAGLKKIGFLNSLRRMAGMSREVRELYRRYPSSPDEFSEWRRRVMEIFSSAKSSFWKR